jgi:putative aminopeptidase FrvX
MPYLLASPVNSIIGLLCHVHAQIISMRFICSCAPINHCCKHQFANGKGKPGQDASKQVLAGLGVRVLLINAKHRYQHSTSKTSKPTAINLF